MVCMLSALGPYGNGPWSFSSGTTGASAGSNEDGNTKGWWPEVEVRETGTAEGRRDWKKKRKDAVTQVVLTRGKLDKKKV